MRRALVVAGLLIALLLAATLGGGAWLWHSEAGLANVMQRVPGLTLEGATGRPTGGPYAVQRLTWQGSGLRVVIEGLAWDDAQWRWRPHAGAWAGLALQGARAARVQVLRTPAAAPAQPSAPPASLQLPLELHAPGLRVGALLVDQQAPLHTLAADVHLGAEQGAAHTVDGLTLQREGLTLTGAARIATTGELPLQAQMQIATAADAAESWRAELQAKGPLQRPVVSARLRHASGAEATAQATLGPFLPWPLRTLEAHTRDLDLHALSPTLPSTRLTGHARQAEPGSAQTATDDLALDIDFTNAAPAAWDTGGLPISALQLRLKGSPADTGRFDVDRLQLQLAAPREAGVLDGTGRWQAGQLALDLRLTGVRPEALHVALPALVLGGPLTLRVDGLPAPAAPAPRTLQAQLGIDLVGQLPRRGTPPLTLQAQATFTRQPDGRLLIAVPQLQARAGAAGGMATASAEAERATTGAWQLRTRGELRAFDPTPWGPAVAPGAAGSRLDGRWQAELATPAPPTTGTPPSFVDTLRGNARFTLDEGSRWAGLAWRGQAELLAGDAELRATADLSAGPNRLQSDARLPKGRSATPEARIDVQAPALAGLAPLAALLPASASAWWPREGALNVQATAQGRWPAVRSEGRLTAQGLRSPQLAIGRMQAQWNLSTNGEDAPLALQLDATDLARGDQRLDALQATLKGSLREHTLALSASSPLRPPAWAETTAGTAGPTGSTMQLQAEGRWAAAPAGGGTWQGRIARLQATPRDAPQAPWLLATDLALRATLDADGALREAAAEPGRVQAFGGALTWQQARWQAVQGGAPRLQLQAQLEPLPLAPILARLQPQFGWQGDLAVAGTARIDSGERFDADIVIERTGGDLSLTIEGARRALEIGNLRLGLAAHGGVWEFTQALVGNSIGVVGGLQTLRTRADLAWPDEAAPLTGGLSLLVPQLQVWAPWLPPGWRLGGNLRVAAAFTGRAGAPEYRGEVTGEALAVRNLFEGINLQQGDLLVTLTGTEAAIQRFEFRDGPGTGRLRVTGGANFGQAPRAQLRATADKLRALDRYDRRITASGAADLDLQASRLALNGALTIDEGLVDATQADAPKLGTDVVVINRAPLRPAGPAAASPAARPPGPARSPLGAADVDLRIGLGDALRLRGRGLDTLLRGQLRVTTPGGQLAVDGTVRAEEGTYRAYGQNLRIERGVLIFKGEVGTPQLDILALRQDIDQRVGVVVSGTAVNPRVRLYSEPELGQLDTLTWLVLGRAPGGLGRDDTALLQRAALALLAGERGGDGNGLLQRIGLDELSLSRGSTGTSTAGDTIVSLGKQISKRVYIGYELALGTAGGTWQLIYRVAGRLTLRARAGGENAIDAIWTWRWD